MWRCINRIEHGQQSCDAVGAEEQKLHAAICRCLNKMFSCKDETLKLLRTNLQYAISGSSASCDLYGIEKQIEELKAREDLAVEMLGKTDGNADRYIEEITKIEEQIKVLKQQMQIAKASLDNNFELNEKINEIEKLFASDNLQFNEFDDIVIRRLVECIRVMKDRRIIVVLKGGLIAEERF